MTIQELKKQLEGLNIESLSAEELANVAGGSINMACLQECYSKQWQDNDGQGLQMCIMNCLA